MINKVFIFILIITLFSCKEKTPTNFVTFSGEITNHLGNNGFLRLEKNKRIIKISKNGTFKDTIHVKGNGALYTFSDGNEFTSLYLKNGEDVYLTLDTKEFDETIKYSGKGSVNNNYLAKKSLLFEKLFSGNLFDLNEKDFTAEVNTKFSKLEDFLLENNNLDSNLIELDKKNISETKKEILSQYKMMKKQKDLFKSFVNKPSPKFENYENYNGGTTSLVDLKGKFVYIDVWATWCGPCKAEIPYLKELEEKYKNKNIKFVSISVDNGRGYKDRSKEAAKKGWRNMIGEKQMGGIQLYSDNAWKSDFIKSFKINSIPRFILIDDKGNVIDANAPRSSSIKIKEVLNKLLN